MFCLSIAAGMLIWGRTLLIAHLGGWVFDLYWVVCLLLSGAAVGLAAADIRCIRRQTRQDHEDLARQTFERIRRGKRDNAPD